MDFYNTIKNLDDEQIRELISFKIDEARYRSQAFTSRFIGVDCDINPTLSIDGEVEPDSQCMWQGFIPEDVKIIYSFIKDKDGYTVNNGCYYYVKDHDYLYEFAKYIKDKDIKKESEFLCHVYNFIENYFYSLTRHDQERMAMHRPLLDKEGRYIPPTSEHLFSDFKNSNSALCSEYSVMAQNILSIFGYVMIYFGGSVNSPTGKGGHAFNFTLVGETPCIVDFTIPVNVYNLEGRIIRQSPFLGAINDFTTETLKRHISEHEPYDFKEYFSVDMGFKEKLYPNGKNRTYVIGNVEVFNKSNHTLQKSINK